jgi:ferredoxin
LRRFYVDALLSWASGGKRLPLNDRGKDGIASAANSGIDVDSRNTNNHVVKIDLERQTYIFRRTRIDFFDTNMARISSIYIDPDTCTCSQACVYECPEVLEVATGDGVPRVREGAERYFESHAEQIMNAADACPVEAIIIKLEEE